METEKILVVDDNKEIVYSISELLKYEGYETLKAYDGMEALDIMERENVDLILLDVMMPRLNGLSALMKLREKSRIPVIILSAKTEESDKVSGLTLGADDYIVKPFPLSVLSQKCMAMIRRSKRVDQEHRLTGKGIVIDLIRKQVYVEGEEVLFSSKDFRLLAYLMENRDVVLEREIILSRIWGYDFEGDTRVVDTHIKRIRKTLNDKGKNIVTKVNVGYMFEEK